ncbi:MAG: hypothetical protein B7Z37_21050 [Verrucomicrobia bacterium 12-59-8]|nr:MAG: hypothetical protein B7Z37_21050 [Verrucomicrobia bacterium 12-59-8]
MRALLALIAVVACMPAPCLAASGNASVRNGAAAAQAVTPLVLVHTAGRSISFGRFTVGSAGTVVVPITGVASTTGGVTFVAGSTTSLDRFVASGDPNRLIGITSSGGTVTSGSNSMAFTTVPMLPAGFIPLTGSGFFTVGGTLSVAAGQAPGSYNGNYVVSVAYN